MLLVFKKKILFVFDKICRTNVQLLIITILFVVYKYNDEL